MPAPARFRPTTAPQPILPRDEGRYLVRALEGLGDSVSRTLDPAIADAQANRVRGEIAAGGEVKPALGLTPIQRARNAVAQRAYLDRVQNEVAARTTELHQEFDGQRLTDADELARRLDAYAAPKLDAVPEAFRGAAQEHYQTLRTKAVGAVRERSFRIEDERNLKESAKADELDLDLARAAARDGDQQELTDALERLAGRRADMVEAGYITEELANLDAREKMDALESERLYGLVLRGQGPSLAEIQAGEGPAGRLGADSRDDLARKVSAHESDQRALVRHNLAVAAAGRKARGESARARADDIAAGVPITPGMQREIDDLLASDLDADDRGELREAYAVRSIVEEATSGLREDGSGGTVQDARAYLSGLDTRQPKDASESRILDGARKGVEGFIADVVGKDPVAAMSRRGMFPDGLPPLDLSSPESAQQTLAQRREAVDVAQMRVGAPMPALTASEATELRTTLDEAGPVDRAAILGAIVAAEGDAVGRTLGMLADSGGEGYAALGAVAARGLPGLASDMAVAASVDTPTRNALLKPEGSASTVLRDYEAAAGGMLSDSPAERGRHIQAAKDLYVARALRGGWGYDPEEFKRAVRDVVGGIAEVRTGGFLGTFGGTVSHVPAVRGVDLQGAIDGLTGADLTAMGGTNLDAATGGPDTVADLIRRSGRLVLPEEGPPGAYEVELELASGLVRLARPDGSGPFLLRLAK